MPDTRPVCAACGEGPVSFTQAYCRHCGLRIDAGDEFAVKAILRDEAGGADEIETLVLDSKDDEPLCWVSDGREVYLVHRNPQGTHLARLSFGPDAFEAVPLHAAPVRDELRGVIATRRGVFLAARTLTGVLHPTTPGETQPFPTSESLLPADQSVVGLATAASGDLFALTWSPERLTLWRGSGMHALRKVASAGGGPEAPSWMRLFVVSETPGKGRALFWGGGRSGSVDLELGAMEVRPEARAVAERLHLHERGALFAHADRNARVDEKAIVPVRGPGDSWGVLRLRDGGYDVAPDELNAPLALGVAGGVILCQQQHSLSAVSHHPDRGLQVRRTDLGLRRIAQGGVAVMPGHAVVALDTREKDVNRVVLHDFEVRADSPPNLSEETHLGALTLRTTGLPWLPPLLTDGAAWVATARPGGGVTIWRLGLA